MKFIRNYVLIAGKLVRNFVYVPQNGALTTWLVARDIHHSASVCRRFFWSQLNLWPDQLPDQTLVVLSGKDSLVPVESTIKMLQIERPDVEVLLHHGHNHADFIKDLPWQDLVVRKLVNIVEAESHHAKMARREAGQQAAATMSANTISRPFDGDESSAPDPAVRRLNGQRGSHGRSDSAYIWELEQQHHSEPRSNPIPKMITRSAARQQKLSCQCNGSHA